VEVEVLAVPTPCQKDQSLEEYPASIQVVERGGATAVLLLSPDGTMVAVPGTGKAAPLASSTRLNFG